MDKYYISINTNSEMKEFHLEQDLNQKQDNKMNSPKILDPSPKTMKRNKSRENFIKFQWSWTL